MAWRNDRLHRSMTVLVSSSARAISASPIAGAPRVFRSSVDPARDRGLEVLPLSIGVHSTSTSSSSVDPTSGRPPSANRCGEALANSGVDDFQRVLLPEIGPDIAAIGGRSLQLLRIDDRGSFDRHRTFALRCLVGDDGTKDLVKHMN